MLNFLFYTTKLDIKININEFNKKNYLFKSMLYLNFKR